MLSVLHVVFFILPLAIISLLNDILILQQASNFFKTLFVMQVICLPLQLIEEHIENLKVCIYVEL